MKPPFKFKPLVVIATVVGVTYPFVVYFGLQVFSPLAIALSLLLFLSFRVVLQWREKKEKIHLISLALTISIVAGLVLIDVLMAVKSYPIALCLSLAAVFGYSLIYPPTIIERFAKMVEPNLNENGILYTRNVTITWIAFFILNSGISLWTALYENIETWALYNGFLSYIFMGCIFMIEFIVRQFVKKKHIGGKT